MEEEPKEPQVVETPEAEQPGDTQVVEQPVVETPGADKEPQKEPERTYTQAEVSAMEAAKDREVAQGRQTLAQIALQLDRERTQAAETQATAQDRQAVEAGTITESEAAQKQTARQQEAIRQQTIRQQMVAYQQMMAQGEQMGRVMAAQNLGKQYEVEADELIKDTSLKTPEAMEAKAAKLALDKIKAELKAAKATPETFDSGQIGGAGAPPLEGKSPMELAQLAYGTDETARRNKRKRR